VPVEIKELVIRGVVNDVQSVAASDKSERSVRSGENLNNDAIVEACVRQVMQLLARERER
jgi:hypothetical protein